MRVLFDNIIYSIQKTGGISVYWYEITKRLDEKISISYIERYRSKGNEYRRLLDISTNQIFCYSSIILSRYNCVKILSIGRKYIFHSSYYRRPCFLSKIFNNITEVVTVHDFTYERHSSGFRRFVHVWQKKRALNSASVIIAISNNTKNDLLEIYPQYKNKDIRIVYNGVSDSYYPLPCLEEKFERPFFLFIGSRKGYKNFKFAVASVAIMLEYDLKIVGPNIESNEKEYLDRFLPHRWEELGFLTNEKLNEYYNRAFALVYPSSYEGFGIPLVEAMKAGCPFLALKGSSVTEIAGEAGFLMKELTNDEFMKGVNFIAKHRDKIIKLGLERAKLFSWDLCAKQTLDIYKFIIENK